MRLVLVEKRNDEVRVVAHSEDVKVIVVDWDALERPGEDVLSRAKQMLDQLTSWSLTHGKEDPKLDAMTWETQRELQAKVRACEFALQDPLEQLDKLMRQHDWYYNMSDDHRVWVAGRAQWERIESYKELVGEQAWQSKWQEHCPWAQREELADD